MARAMEGAVAQALRSVLDRVQRAAEKSGRSPSRGFIFGANRNNGREPKPTNMSNVDGQQVTVVAVSKTKPISLISEVYNVGHRHFGENYVQEIIEKAPQLPNDIKWHFIGHLQSNKAKALVASVPNLYMVEGIDSQKVANNLDRAVAGLGRARLKVLVQVNTSGEESKSGVEPEECLALVRHVRTECPNLEFSGLMTIGMPDYTSTPENFKTLANCRRDVCNELQIPEEDLQLSMGMSGDFELAVEMGSTNVRIGSTIFGPREYPAKK